LQTAYVTVEAAATKAFNEETISNLSEMRQEHQAAISEEASGRFGPRLTALLVHLTSGLPHATPGGGNGER